MKKILSMLLSMVMVVSCIPGAAFAATEKPDEKVTLEDGTYVVQGSMVKVDQKTPSMSDKGINHNIKLTVKGNEYRATLNFKGIQIGDKFGYLGSLKYFKTKYTTDKYGRPEGDVLNSKVEAWQKDKNGKDIIDPYSKKKAPSRVSFPLIPEAREKDGFVPLQVFVPVMDSIAAGLGTQEVYLKLDWKTAKRADVISADKVTLSSYFKAINGGYRGTYNGNQMKAIPVVKNAFGETLKNNVDYKVSYSNSVRKNVGTYSFTVNGIGNYKGTVKKKLIITPKKVTNLGVRAGANQTTGYNDAYITWSKSAGATGYYVYSKESGKDWHQDAIVKTNSYFNQKLKDGKRYDFKVIPYYRDGINYMTREGFSTVYLNTLKKMPAPSVVKNRNGGVTVKWTKIPGAAGYQISRSTSPSKISILEANNNASKIVKPYKNKKYYYKVRAYKNIKKNGKAIKVYAPWSAARVFTLR